MDSKELREKMTDSQKTKNLAGTCPKCENNLLFYKGGKFICPQCGELEIRITDQEKLRKIKEEALLTDEEIKEAYRSCKTGDFIKSFQGFNLERSICKTQIDKLLNHKDILVKSDNQKLLNMLKDNWVRAFKPSEVKDGS